MQWTPIPPPPTDDLSKYAAITGLWLTFAFSVLLAFVTYVSYAMRGHTSVVMQIVRSESFLRDIDARIKSIEAGRFNENVMKASSGRDPRSELALLRNFAEVTRPSLEQAKLLSSRDKSSDYFKLLQVAYVYYWLPFAIVMSLAISLLGFLGWRKKQKVVDEMVKLDLDIRKRQLRLLDLEEAERLLTFRCS